MSYHFRRNIFSIEGNIGSGKSTLTKFLQIAQQELFTELSLSIIQEPVDDWKNQKDTNGESILGHFYNDPEKYSFAFQMNSFISRSHKIMEQLYDTVLVERSVFSDAYCFACLCYENNLMTEMEYLIYKKWFTWLTKSFNIKNTGVIYLRTDPDECYNRIQKRNRSEETQISREYLHQLHKKHDEWLMNGKNILVLDGNKDFLNDPNILKDYLDKIKQFIKSQIILQ